MSTVCYGISSVFVCLYAFAPDQSKAIEALLLTIYWALAAIFWQLREATQASRKI